MSAAGDHRAIAGRRWNAHEHRFQAQCADPQPELVILGHAAADERATVVHCGNARQRLASDRAADAGQRDRSPDRFAHHHLLGVGFGELIAIMAADPLRAGVDQRQHRKLDHSGTVDQPIEQHKLERMDDVLGVVEHDRLGRLVGVEFVGDQRVMQEIEAIGLGGRSIGFDSNRFDPEIGDAGDRGGGRWIVAVITDEDLVVGMLDALEGRAQHR